MFYKSILAGAFSEVDFGADHGKLYFGPIHKNAAAKIKPILNAFDLTTGADGRIAIVPVTAELVRIEVSGEGVCGYFNEIDGMEAADETLDAFVLQVCPKNYPVTISGHYHPDDETRINTVMTAVHDGVSVRWSRLRNRLRDGASLCISAPCNPSLSD